MENQTQDHAGLRDLTFATTQSAVILHIPHAATAIPESFRSSYFLEDAALELELRKLTDWFTDELFVDLEYPLPAIRFPYSRLLIDVERFTDDAKEPMAQLGMGMFYTRTTSGEPLRARPESSAAEQLLRYRAEHQEKLAMLVDAALEMHGRAVIIDCHSFPRVALPCHHYTSPSDIAYCIGTDSYHTPAWLCEWFVDALASEAGPVTVDQPFSGAFVPERHYRQNPRVLSVMIEVNRGLYMDEELGQKSWRFIGIQTHLQKTMRRFADFFNNT